MVQFTYISEAWATMTKKPQDRTIPSRDLVEKLGGKLPGLYYSLGEYDGMALFLCRPGFIRSFRAHAPARFLPAWPGNQDQHWASACVRTREPTARWHAGLPGPDRRVPPGDRIQTLPDTPARRVCPAQQAQEGPPRYRGQARSLRCVRRVQRLDRVALSPGALSSPDPELLLPESHSFKRRDRRRQKGSEKT